MREPRFISCRWTDAWGDPAGDATFENVRDKHKPAQMQTVGWLLWEDEIGVSIFNERDTEDGSYRGRTFIPKGMVQTIDDYPPKRKRRPKIKDTNETIT